SRCARSIPRTTCTTAPRSAACRTAENRPRPAGKRLAGNIRSAPCINSSRTMKPLRTTSLDEADDSELARLIGRGDHSAFEQLMRRHNGKLFRVARAILRDDAEAEDALQEAYLDAYRHINDYRGEARLSTWLTRIVVNHALMRRRKQVR